MGDGRSINNLLPKEPHCAIICGQTACGKTAFVLDILQSHYRDVFNHIIIPCPTISVNKTYLSRDWVMNDPEVYKVDPRDRLQDCLRVCHEKYKGESTLFIIDDCSASKELTKKKDMLSYLAFSEDILSIAFGYLLKNTTLSSKISESRPISLQRPRLI